MVAAARSASSVPPSTTVRMALLMSWSSGTNRTSSALAVGVRNGQVPHRCPPTQKIGEQIVARGRQYGFWMELNSFDRQYAMPQAHDETVGLGRNLELWRQGRSLHDQRVISGGLKR